MDYASETQKINQLSPQLQEAKDISDVGKVLSDLRVLVGSRYLPDSLKRDLTGYIFHCEQDLSEMLGVPLKNGGEYPKKKILDFATDFDDDIEEVEKEDLVFSYDDELNAYYSQINPVLKEISELHERGVSHDSKEFQGLIAKRDALYDKYDEIRRRHMYDGK